MDLFSQVSEALTLQPNGAAGKTYSIASGTSSDKKSSNTIGQKPKAMAILPKPILPNGADQLTLFPVAFHASPTARQGNDSEKKMNAIYGLKCLEQYERLPQVSSWAKTFAALLIGTGDWYSTRCKLTWKISGIKSRPFLYLRRLSTPRTAVIEYGLLPTVTAMDSTNATANMKSSQVKEGSMRSVTLSRAMAMGLLYSPKANDFRNQRKTENWKGTDLSSQVKDLTGINSQLNPRFVAEMMGFPPNWTELPFQNGETKVSKPMEMP